MYRKIKELCKQNNISILGLETKLGLARGSIYKMDAHKPSAEKVKKIADFFGVSIEELLV